MARRKSLAHTLADMQLQELLAKNGAVCAETLHARKLIAGGMGVPQACKIAGISHTTMYRSAWYKARIGGENVAHTAA